MQVHDVDCLRGRGSASRVKTADVTEGLVLDSTEKGHVQRPVPSFIAGILLVVSALCRRNDGGSLPRVVDLLVPTALYCNGKGPLDIRMVVEVVRATATVRATSQGESSLYVMLSHASRATHRGERRSTWRSPGIIVPSTSTLFIFI